MSRRFGKRQTLDEKLRLTASSRAKKTRIIAFDLGIQVALVHTSLLATVLYRLFCATYYENFPRMHDRFVA
jgi:hypothetical protein